MRCRKTTVAQDECLRGRFLPLWAAVRLPIYTCGVFALLQSATAQTSSGSRLGTATSSLPANSATPSTTTATVNVTGRVVDAQTGAPVPRALVSMSSRSVLTDAQGQFNFPDFTSNSVQARVTKPGYTQTLDASGAGQFITDFSSTITLLIYRQALIEGQVLGSDGAPISRAQVQVFRDLGEDQGNRLVPVSMALTDSHGQYRSEQPPGRYRIALRYSARATPDGEAMLPVEYPERSGGDTASTFRLTPGQDRRIDLQARTSEPFRVTLKTDAPEGRGNLRITARAANGAEFAVFARPTETPGEYRIDLPSAAYRLTGLCQDRDQHLEGETRVTVSGKPVNGVVLHLAELPSIPVELVAEAASTSATTSSIQASTTPATSVPNLNLFNLRLQSTGDSIQNGGDEVRLTATANQTFVLIATPGTYRLRGQANGSWYIKSASYGTTDLLTQRLTVAPGSGGEPIRIVAANDLGQVTGTVTGLTAGARAVIYLLARDPSLSAVRSFRSNSDGTYSAKLPPGGYTAVALDDSYSGSLSDPQVLAKVAAGATAVAVTSAGQATADLKLMSVGQLP